MISIDQSLDYHRMQCIKIYDIILPPRDPSKRNGYHLLLLVASRVLWQLPDIWDKLPSLHIRLQDRRDPQPFLSLPVFNHTAQGSFSRTQGPVEHVNEFNRFTRLTVTVSDIEASGLVVCAVGARDEFLVLALHWEPRFEIILYRCRIVEGGRDDADDSVRELEGLVKGFRVGEHLVQHGW